MHKATKVIALAVFISAALIVACYPLGISIADIVSQYRNSTNLQKVQTEKDLMYQKISVSAKVQNVEPWNLFNQQSDTSTYYYKVTTYPQKTADGIPYEILVFYKDKNEAEAINKDQELSLDGALFRILDQRLIVSVFVFADELTDSDKEMLNRAYQVAGAP